MSIYQFLSTALLTLIITSTAHGEKATFAGGCFWCVEAAFQELTGVESAVSGFTGGTLINPTYDGNHEGHYEAVEVTYDPSIITYSQLLNVFWMNIDPFDADGQFCDRGPSYRSAVFTHNSEQKVLAEQSKKEIAARFSGLKVVTEILDTSTFYPVEAHHQDYFQKNPLRYRFYRAGCRRDHRIEEIWGEATRNSH